MSQSGQDYVKEVGCCRNSENLLLSLEIWEGISEESRETGLIKDLGMVIQMEGERLMGSVI